MKEMDFQNHAFIPVNFLEPSTHNNSLVVIESRKLRGKKIWNENPYATVDISLEKQNCQYDFFRLKIVTEREKTSEV